MCSSSAAFAAVSGTCDHRRLATAARELDDLVRLGELYRAHARSKRGGRPARARAGRSDARGVGCPGLITRRSRMRPWSAWRRSCGSRPRSVLGGEKPTRRTGLVGPQFRADADEADASVERNRSLRPGHFAQRCAAFSSPFVTAGVTASVNSAKNILARNAALAGTFSAPRETRTPTRGTPGQGPQPCGDGSARHDIYRSESLSRGWLDEGERESAQVNLGQLRISLCAKRSGRRAAPKRRAKSAPSP